MELRIGKQMRCTHGQDARVTNVSLRFRGGPCPRPRKMGRFTNHRSGGRGHVLALEGPRHAHARSGRHDDMRSCARARAWHPNLSVISESEPRRVSNRTDRGRQRGAVNGAWLVFLGSILLLVALVLM